MGVAYILENNVITNAIVIDENTDLQAFGAVTFPRGQHVQIGYTVINGVVHDRDGNVVEPIDEELLLISDVNAQIQEKINELNNISIFVWNSMTEQKKQALTEYHQALLAISTQPDFPRNIVWPNKPE